MTVRPAPQDSARQLALPFPHAPHYDAEDFCEAASNEAALTWLARTTEWPDRRLALWGEEGRGKTHLLRRWVRQHGAVLIDGPTLRGLIAPPRHPLAVDDADAVADEAALLHLLNAAREAALPVLLAGRPPPTRWPLHLPDLVSRLRAITAVELGRPEDELLRTLFSRLLTDRQLAVPEAVRDWLLLRLPRSAAAVREAACRLDHASLAAGHRVGRALAAQILADFQLLEAEEEVSDDVFASNHAGISPPSLPLL